VFFAQLGETCYIVALNKTQLTEDRVMDSEKDGNLEATIDSISKGLRMGMADIYGQLLSFDKDNIENNRPSFAYAFVDKKATEAGQTLDEFLSEQMEALKEYQEYKETLNGL